MKKFTGYTKGINLGGWLSQCDHSRETYNTFITKNDIDRIASWGLDHIRLPIDYELVETEDGQYVEEGFSYIDNCLDWCQSNGLNMILDLHKTAGYSFDEFETSTGFFENDTLQNRFMNLWEELAKRYGKYEDRLSFELLNEIVDPEVADIWNGIAKRTVKVIRQYAPTIKILIGGVRNNSVDSIKLLDMPYDENIVYTFHFYEPLIFTHQAAYWVNKMTADFRTVYPNEFAKYRLETEAFLPSENGEIYSNITQDIIDKKFFETAFLEAIRVANERDVALYCGEYGVIDQADLPSTINWYSDINSTFEKFEIGRAAWTYKGKDFGIIDKHYEPIFDRLIKLL
ncbi:cellulase family glycosylhydrolase [Mobilitalea sibirica]|uniref:Cellulase family glycosylhydrolase n=1 Tax=Mobilitalea sibirica TaxID=1462919 RepID=A0A8J7HBG2_9FIRM|nr:cellulase family glycosylhydrolase [Mobilitalea sibirica]MBH1941051.1 cellulase family glycosylhydrolase [Mobilitalea sibirica]